MPVLHWASKSLPSFATTPLITDSVTYPQGGGYTPEIRRVYPGFNRLILGDNLAVMAALLPEFEEKIDLIYADPPFFTNRAYPARIGRGEDSRKPREWQLAEGYPDHWSTIDTYLDFLYPRLVLMYRLLSPTGTLYLHLDWHADAYARLLLDEIFGYERLLNEIVWCYHGPSPIRSAFNRKHDTLLAYTKSNRYTFNVDDVRQPYDPSTLKTFASSPKAGFGKMPDLARGKVPEDWWYFPVVARLHSERTGYPTQKPEALLERIIRVSSQPGSLVADFFCGSGTTPVVASRLGRRYIASDIIARAIHTTRSRLIQSHIPSHGGGLTGALPFMLQSVSRVEIMNHAPLQVDVNGSEIAINPEMLFDLDLWEVDPDFDNTIFHSTAQAIRPRKNQLISGKVDLTRPPSQLAIRWVTVDGQFYQTQIER